MTASKNLLERLKEAKARVEASAEERKDMASRVAAGAILTPDQSQGARRLSFINMVGAVTAINAAASPLEFLVSNGDMESGEDEEGMAGLRFHVATHFRSLSAGAQINGIKPINFESSGGGVAPGSIDPMARQIDCWKILARARQDIGEAWVFILLEAVVVHDEWFDLKPIPAATDKHGIRRKRRRKTIAALHYGLDKLAESLGHISGHCVRSRWPSGTPPIPSSVRRHILASTARGRPVPPS